MPSLTSSFAPGCSARRVPHRGAGPPPGPSWSKAREARRAGPPGRA
ncbi:hypothetical protein HBB16_00510 [Pseudonocardia sp. MCCB 268]|nr:hypothetical protein [Pseudonocardia cytotoxica]